MEADMIRSPSPRPPVQQSPQLQPLQQQQFQQPQQFQQQQQIQQQQNIRPQVVPINTNISGAPQRQALPLNLQQSSLQQQSQQQQQQQSQQQQQPLPQQQQSPRPGVPQIRRQDSRSQLQAPPRPQGPSPIPQQFQSPQGVRHLGPQQQQRPPLSPNINPNIQNLNQNKPGPVQNFAPRTPVPGLNTQVIQNRPQHPVQPQHPLQPQQNTQPLQQQQFQQQQRPQFTRPQMQPNTNYPQQPGQPIQIQGQVRTVPLNQPRPPTPINQVRPGSFQSSSPQQNYPQQQQPQQQHSPPLPSTVPNTYQQQPLRPQSSLERIRLQQGRDSPENRMASDVVTPKPETPSRSNTMGSTDDDDDDVVVGRMTPARSPFLANKTPELFENLNSNTEIKPLSTNGNNYTFDNFITQNSKSPSPMPVSQSPEVPTLHRTDSKKSLPSRPPSVLEGSRNSPENINYTLDDHKVERLSNPPSRPDSKAEFIKDLPKNLSPEPIAGRLSSFANSHEMAGRDYSKPISPNQSSNNLPRISPELSDIRRSPLPDLNESKSEIMKKSPTPELSLGSKSPLPSDHFKNKSPTPPKSPISLNSIINPDRPSLSLSPDNKPTVRIQDPLPKSPSSMGRITPTTPVETIKSPTVATRPSSLINGDSKRTHKPSVKISPKGDNDSGVDESTQGNERNGPGSPGSPLKPHSRPPSATPSNKSRSTSKTRASIVKTPDTPVEPSKKLPMNKIQVGNTPSPNLKSIKSKIGSLDNAAHKPGGGHIKIETKKLEFKAAPRIEAKNDKYAPGGGDKKSIVQTKLNWNAKSKIGSLENAHYKPGGGDKKIETIKTDFTGKAKPKVGSKDNMKYTPGGGDIKASAEDKPKRPIQIHKLDIKAQSKIGSLDNVKYKPGGGDKKIFDDKDYLKNIDHPITPSPPSQYWRTTTLTTSMSLPAECIVLSVTAPSPLRKIRRLSGTDRFSKGKTTLLRYSKSAAASTTIHKKPFKLY